MTDKLTDVVQFCVSQISHQSKRPLFVAITGDSGSGKSYLTTLIKKGLEESNLSCTVLNHDDFLISRQDREPMKKIFYKEGPFAGKSHWEILENMFRLDDFMNVISDLKDGKCSNYFSYSRDTGTVNTNTSRVCPADINLFDTSMMSEHMDYVVLVDVTQENIIKRKLDRDSDIRASEDILDMHKRVQGYYWQRAKPSNADIIIDNNDYANIHVVQS